MVVSSTVPLAAPIDMSIFPIIRHIDDLRPHLADKKEMRFMTQPNGVTIGCYQFSDSRTFDSALALECRGIAFGPDGQVVSRPLHKFFNLGERPGVLSEDVLARADLVGVYDKLDGSMIATAWLNDELHWRSKQSFGSDVVRLAKTFLAEPAQAAMVAFANKVAKAGWTAIFELTHPEARIVVNPGAPRMRLLHVRDNLTGTYLLLDPSHIIHELVAEHGVERVPSFDFDIAQARGTLDDMVQREGYVYQFSDGDMVKDKCGWYQRLHRSVTFLRERDIALLALTQGLDDIKGALGETGIDMTPILEVEARVKDRLIEIGDRIEAIYQEGKALDRKSFALAYKADPLFGLAMNRYLGQDVPLTDWFLKARLREEFSLRVLASDAVAEALAG